MRLLAALLVVGLAGSGLAGCGEDEPATTVVPADDADAGRKAVEFVIAQAMATRLDSDEAMADLYARHKQFRTAGEDARSMSRSQRFAAHGAAMMKWQAMLDASEEGGLARKRRELEQIDGNLQRAKDDLPNLEGDELAHARVMIRTYETMRPALTSSLGMIEKLATPQVAALVAKWKPRFDALEASLGN